MHNKHPVAYQVAPPRECWIPWAQELQLQEIPHHCLFTGCNSQLNIFSACLDKGFFFFPSQMIQRLWGCALVTLWICLLWGEPRWSEVRALQVPASPSWHRRVCSCPASKTKSLALRGWAWSSAGQGEFIPLSIALVLTDWSSAKGEDNAEPYNQLLDFPKLQFLALQFKFESCCLDVVCSSCFAIEQCGNEITGVTTCFLLQRKLIMPDVIKPQPTLCLFQRQNLPWVLIAKLTWCTRQRNLQGGAGGGTFSVERASGH